MHGGDRLIPRGTRSTAQAIVAAFIVATVALSLLAVSSIAEMHDSAHVYRDGVPATTDAHGGLPIEQPTRYERVAAIIE